MKYGVEGVINSPFQDTGKSGKVRQGLSLTRSEKLSRVVLMKIEGKLEKKAGEKLWGVDIPEIGIFTQGRTKKEAYNMAKEAIELVVNLEGFKVTIEPVQNNKFFIIPNNIGPILAMILRQKRVDNGLSIREVADRLGQSSPNSYGRYENGKSVPTIEKFDELLAAIDPGLSSILRVA